MRSTRASTFECWPCAAHSVSHATSSCPKLRVRHQVSPCVCTNIIIHADCMGRWRSWLSHLSNTQKVLSSNLGRLIFEPLPAFLFIYHLFKIAQLLSEVKKIMRKARILTIAELQYVIFPHAFFHNNDSINVTINSIILALGTIKIFRLPVC